MLRILVFIQRSAFRRFRTGDAGPWGAIAIGLFGLRMVVKWSARNVDVVYREVLKPGEHVDITHLTQTRTDIAKMDQRALKVGKKQVKISRNEAKASKKSAAVQRRSAKATKGVRSVADG